MSRPASVQRTRISLEAIEDDVVRLAGSHGPQTLTFVGDECAAELDQPRVLAGDEPAAGWQLDAVRRRSRGQHRRDKELSAQST